MAQGCLNPWLIHLIRNVELLCTGVIGEQREVPLLKQWLRRLQILVFRRLLRLLRYHELRRFQLCLLLPLPAVNLALCLPGDLLRLNSLSFTFQEWFRLFFFILAQQGDLWWLRAISGLILLRCFTQHRLLRLR